MCILFYKFVHCKRGRKKSRLFRGHVRPLSGRGRGVCPPPAEKNFSLPWTIFIKTIFLFCHPCLSWSWGVEGGGVVRAKGTCPLKSRVFSKLQGNSRKRVREMSVFYTLYTIYLSLWTQTTKTTPPEPFFVNFPSLEQKVFSQVMNRTYRNRGNAKSW